MAVVRTHEPLRLLDTLLCCALIEARSCERMQLLAGALEDDRVAGRDPALAKLYRGLLACEARHHGTYVELARSLDLVEGSEFERRFAEVSEHEAAVIDQAPDVYRLHAGHRSAIRPQSDRSRR
jgi:tRNA-(ms[2]io[6]A)-hydroxylase